MRVDAHPDRLRNASGRPTSCGEHSPPASARFRIGYRSQARSSICRATSQCARHRGQSVSDLPRAISGSDICITCTPSRKVIVDRDWVPPGCLVAAVGADNENKQEIDPALFRSARVVVDSLEQCATIGDLHHAIDSGAITRNEVHAELGEIIAARKPGRQSETETIIFDSSGVALGDVAAAALVYERAVELGRGASIRLTD